MSSILYCLQFTGEDGSMYNDGKLPTLDTALWISNVKIKYTFYEKPTVGYQVLRRDTALLTASIRSTLLQETVRRLLNCNVGTDVETIQAILLTFAQKLVNSGHSQLSAKIFIIQGIMKYLHRVRLSKLPKDDECYKPLYLSKSFNEEQRKVKKYLAKMEWFRGNKEKTIQTDLGDWRKQLKFSTILQVPNSKDAKLFNLLVEQEKELAGLTGCNVKMLERSGIPLSRLFQRVSVQDNCHWDKCPVCLVLNKGGKKSRMCCRRSNVVYKATCFTCEQAAEVKTNGSNVVGVYVGESSRTLAERSGEHIQGCKSLNIDNFILKHWINCHEDLTTPPLVRFRVVKSFNDPLSRMLA